jgi:hypothetical protein
MQKELEHIREWAAAKIQGGSEPPWAWYQYMKLIETADAILNGMAATTTVSSPPTAQHSDAHLRLVASTDRRGNARPRHVGLPVHLPT